MRVFGAGTVSAQLWTVLLTCSISARGGAPNSCRYSGLNCVSLEVLNRAIVPIPGTRRIARLEENAAATPIALTKAEERRIADVLAERKVAGTRYPAAAMAAVNV